MAASAEELLKKALELNEPERARLVTQLLASLEPETTALSDEEWVAEIERRARAALAGRPCVSWTEARQEIQERLKSN